MPRRAVWPVLGVVAVVAAVVFVVDVDQGDDRRPPAPDRKALSPGEYRRELNAVVKRAPLLGTPTDVAGLRERAAEYRGFADDLAGIAPPRDAADMHGRMIDGLNGHAALLDRHADRGAAGLATFEQHLTSGSGASEIKWTQAFNELIARGYVTYRLD
jgi:hypothetical protein